MAVHEEEVPLVEGEYVIDAYGEYTRWRDTDIFKTVCVAKRWREKSVFRDLLCAVRGLHSPVNG